MLRMRRWSGTGLACSLGAVAVAVAVGVGLVGAPRRGARYPEKRVLVPHLDLITSTDVP